MTSAQKSWSHRLVWRSLVLAGLALGAVVLSFGALREQPLFWSHDGGYPRWLRGVVAVGFYPLVLAQFGTVIAASVVYVRDSRTGSAMRRQTAALIALWSVGFACAVVAFEDNIEDLIEHRPVRLHLER
jgi:hypothetical protein